MRKIVHIAESFATGVLSFLIDLTERQAENYDVYILYGLRPLTPENVESLFDSRIHLIRMKSFKGALGTIANPFAYFEIYKRCKEIRPDIIHLHSSAAGFAGRWSLPCGRVPVFYTPHGYSFLSGNGNSLKRGLFKTMERLAALRKAKTIACSKGEYREALKLSTNAACVNNGINIRELQPYVRPFRKPGKTVRVCTSGRIMQQKNPSLFNEIAECLPDIQFTWIGGGELECLLRSSNIEITGWVSRENALATLRDADFFILPSLWEGLPISLLEAMYMKKVCLVSGVTGNRDVIRNGENGFICCRAEEYAGIIRSVISGNISGTALADAASADVEREYNAGLMAEKYDKIFSQTVG